MRIKIRRGALQSTLLAAQWTLAAAGVLMLGYCGLVMAGTWAFQRDQNRRLGELMETRQAAGSPMLRASEAVPLQISHGAAQGGLIGRLEIPRLGLSVVVVEGVDQSTLRRSAGHIPGTALPGQPGNVGISGHRDTLFRPLRNIRKDDAITVTTVFGEYRYRVVSTRIVAPTDVSVLDPGKDEVLTLVTCYPFYFIGPAPSRFIVRAERMI